MKKIIIPITFTILLVFSLTSCKSSDSAAEASEEVSSSIEAYSQMATETNQGIDLTSEYQLATINFQNESYPPLYHALYSLSMSGLLDSSWDASDQTTFTADQLVKYAFYFQSSSNDGKTSTSLSASEVESTASFAFGVESSFLQTSSYYDTSGTYSLPNDEASVPVTMINSPDYGREQVTVLWMGQTSETYQTYHIIAETYVSFTTDEEGTTFTFNACAYTDYQLQSDESSDESSLDSADDLLEESILLEPEDETVA